MALVDQNSTPDAPDAASRPATHPGSVPIPRRRDLHPRVAAFWYAFEGVGHLFRTQLHAQIHITVAVIIVAMGFGFAISRLEWLAIIVMITMVLAAEGANTAIEAAVDLAAPGYHPLAKIAKDVAAGTVLLTAIGAVVVGVVIFLPRIWAIVAPWIGW